MDHFAGTAQNVAPFVATVVLVLVAGIASRLRPGWFAARARRERDGKRRIVAGNPGNHWPDHSDFRAARALTTALPRISDARRNARADPRLARAYRVLYDVGPSPVRRPAPFNEAAERGAAARQTIRELGLRPAKMSKEIIGYRVWRVGFRGGSPFLQSAHMPNLWEPAVAMSGEVRLDDPTAWRGVHAYASLKCLEDELAFWERKGNAYALGTVSLWGTVVICAHGYRAQHGYPRTLYWTNAGPQILRDLASTYGCELTWLGL
jgi:hypothetical protein